MKDAIVTVGGGGRGFLVEGLGHLGRMVVTAAHCLPFLPPAHPSSFSHERAYVDCLGALGVAPTVMAECLFVDPIADVAVLCRPDNQTFCDEAEAYDEFVDARPVLRIGVMTAPSDVRLQTLDGRWEACTAQLGSPYSQARTLTLVGARDGNVPGTSGSPILTVDGRAIGVISVGTEIAGIAVNEQGDQPILASVLPLWLLSNLRVDTRKAHSMCRQWIDAVRRDHQALGEGGA